MHENHHHGKYKNQHHNWPQPFGGVCAYQYAIKSELTMAIKQLLYMMQTHDMIYMDVQH